MTSRPQATRFAAAIAAVALTSCGGVTDVERITPWHGDASAGDGGARGSGGFVSNGGREPLGAGGARASSGGAPVPPDAGTPADGGGAGGAGGDAGSPDGAAVASDGGLPWGEHAGPLAGHYDVWLDEPGDGCAFLSGASRLNLSIGGADAPAIRYFADYEWWWREATAGLEPGVVRIDPMGWEPVETHPTLWLDLGDGGLLGTGRALAPVTCPGGIAETLQVPARVTPDRTPPVVIARPLSGWPYTFPFTEALVSMSEPPDYWNGSLGTPGFSSVPEVEGRITWLDAASGAPLATRFLPNLAGPAVHLALLSQEGMAGRSIRLGMVDPPRDAAGNAAVADPLTLVMDDAGPLLRGWDFDDGPLPGARGAATYLPPGAPGAPCESGGCLLLEAGESACEDRDLGGGILAVRLDVPPGHEARLRYRAWTDGPTGLELQIEDPSWCTLVENPRVAPLAQADGLYTHASDWSTVVLSACRGPVDEVDSVIAPPCASGAARVRARLVVERIDVVPRDP
jgi:hypothetical protein